MTLKKRKEARVLKLAQDGAEATIAFTDEHGDRVIGEYVLAGWAWPPAALAAKVDEVLRRPPIVIYGRHPKDPRNRQ